MIGVPKLIPLLTICCLPVSTLAGEPVNTAISCPLGGEEFSIVETTSYSFEDTRRMSFAPISTADFITRLPQCPANGLPLYRDFTEAEIEILEDLLGTEAFASERQKSRYFLAYWLETQLPGNDPSTRFEVLLGGLWYDTKIAFASDEYLSAFIVEAKSGLERTDANNKPFLQAILAYVLMHSGQSADATILLQNIRLSPQFEIPILAAYVKQIESCTLQPEQDLCDPHAKIELQ